VFKLEENFTCRSAGTRNYCNDLRGLLRVGN
jgi:hypothetical protein